MRRTLHFLATTVLGIHAVLLAYGAHVHSPTLNEAGHLVAGISNWQFGRFEVYKVNPPLVRMVAAVPVLLAGANTDWDSFDARPGARPEFSLGEDFVAANGQRSLWLFTLARWMCIPFSLVGGYVCFHWGSELYGRTAGILALSLWCFCPSTLGHGALITPDVAATALAVAAGYTFWRWLKEPTWGRTLTSGLVLGVAELAKTTLVVLYPLWIVMWLVYRLAERWERRPLTPGPSPAKGEGSKRRWGRELGMLVVRMVVALYVINLGYGFEGSLTRLGEFKFVSAALAAEAGAETAPAGGGNRFAETWLASLPVPLPKNYVLGIDLQKRDFENYSNPSYLRGEFRDKAWWYYYLYALAINVPLGTWALVGLAAGAGAFGSRLAPRDDSGGGDEASRRAVAELRSVASPLASRGARGLRDEFILLAPAVVILVFVSSQAGFSEHTRYVLPCFPFVFVWVGTLAFVFSREWWGRTAPSPEKKTEGPHPALSQRQRVFRRLVTGVAAAALVWSIGSSLWVYPHSLSYFNELVGGPSGGPQHLIHSNVDWGQDLLFLEDWLDEHPQANPINLIYFGYFDPKHAGIQYTVPAELLEHQNGPLLVEKIPRGWYAVSVNFVRGYPWFVYKPDETKAGLPQNALVAFQRLKPAAMTGYSIYIYRVE